MIYNCINIVDINEVESITILQFAIFQKKPETLSVQN